MSAARDDRCVVCRSAATDASGLCRCRCAKMVHWEAPCFAACSRCFEEMCLVCRRPEGHVCFEGCSGDDFDSNASTWGSGESAAEVEAVSILAATVEPERLAPGDATPPVSAVNADGFDDLLPGVDAWLAPPDGVDDDNAMVRDPSPESPPSPADSVAADAEDTWCLVSRRWGTAHKVRDGAGAGLFTACGLPASEASHRRMRFSQAGRFAQCRRDNCFGGRFHASDVRRPSLPLCEKKVPKVSNLSQP